jgi:hypothetical protein
MYDVTKANFRKVTRDADLTSYMLLCTKYLLDLKYCLRIFQDKGKFKLELTVTKSQGQWKLN